MTAGRTTAGWFWLALLGYGQIELRGHSHEIREGVGFQLAHDLTAMTLDGRFTRSELSSNLLVQQARHHKPHHLALTIGQRFIATSERPPVGLLVSRLSAWSLAPEAREVYRDAPFPVLDSPAKLVRIAKALTWISS